MLALFVALLPVVAGDWPQWRGPQRDGVCAETGLLPQWPEGGPKLLWASTNLGRGYSSAVNVGERIYLTGDLGDDLHIFALDLAGRHVWRATNGASWLKPYPGARSTVTFHDGKLYHLNAHGRVACLEAETGKEVWAVNILERFGGTNLHWGLSECLLVDGNRVIVTPGGSKGLMAALDKQTGETVWASEPLLLGDSPSPSQQRVAEPFGEVDGASYASPILFEQGGRRMIVSCSLRHVFGLDAETGRLLWTRPLPTRYQVIATTPVRINDAVFVTAPDGQGGTLYRLRVSTDGADVAAVWRTELDACQGGVVYWNGSLYGAMYRRKQTWVSLDAGTGATRYRLEGLDKGPVLYADQRLYCVSEDGEIALLKPGAEGFETKGRFQFVSGRRNDVWAHPVIANGRLYLRYNETLHCNDVKAQ